MDYFLNYSFRMNSSKGVREEDFPPPVSKQLRIDYFYSAQISISNRFSVLRSLGSEVTATSAVYYTLLEDEAGDNRINESQEKQLSL